MEDGVRDDRAGCDEPVLPARFMLAAAMNPCPCGWFGDPHHTCACGSLVRTALSRAPSPGRCFDRIDIHLEVPAVKYKRLTPAKSGGEE